MTTMLKDHSGRMEPLEQGKTAKTKQMKGDKAESNCVTACVSERENPIDTEGNKPAGV